MEPHSGISKPSEWQSLIQFGDERLPDRFWSKVKQSGECWLWIASKRSDGYGQFRTRSPRRMARAHRVAYEAMVGEIADGMVLDHLCRVIECVNPLHLDPVSQRENVLRGVGPAAVHFAKTHCKNGHEFSPGNTYVFKCTPTVRVCRACQLASNARYAAKRRSTKDVD